MKFLVLGEVGKAAMLSMHFTQRENEQVGVEGRHQGTEVKSTSEPSWGVRSARKGELTAPGLCPAHKTQEDSRCFQTGKK